MHHYHHLISPSASSSKNIAGETDNSENVKEKILMKLNAMEYSIDGTFTVGCVDDDSSLSTPRLSREISKLGHYANSKKQKKENDNALANSTLVVLQDMEEALNSSNENDKLGSWDTGVVAAVVGAAPGDGVAAAVADGAADDAVAGAGRAGSNSKGAVSRVVGSTVGCAGVLLE
ncbi:uncharacterized protein LOC126413129 [Schistocerca serialis cubense]|uniref:uncharacterized protein LOC126413129 n=1 Tax=Schistocerca serialis cubense TaxID=2023355 RepID=UPI00214E46B8|nr:uncharacterized protein LOC126413129 [Schistocerca serialis cubense]